MKLVGIGASGSLYDFFCYSVAGTTVWSGAAFVAWVDANYQTYRVVATELGLSGRFTGTAPAGTVSYEMRPRGASLAASPAVFEFDSSLLHIGSGTGEILLSGGIVDVVSEVVEVTGSVAGNVTGSVVGGVGYAAASHVGTAGAGGATTITLAGTASATNDLYKGQIVFVYFNTGAGQSRRITGYVGATKVATVDYAWATNPASGSLYAVLAAAGAKTDSNLVVAADVMYFGGVAGTFTGGRPEVNTTHAAGTAWNSGGITSSTFVANAINAAALAADAATEIAAAVEVAILNEGDLSAVLEAIRLKIEESDDDLTTTLIRDAILNRALLGNHDTAGTVGAFLQKLDAAISTRMATFTLPTNFSSMGINVSGHLSRVTLVDTVTALTEEISGGGLTAPQEAKIDKILDLSQS